MSIQEYLNWLIKVAGLKCGDDFVELYGNGKISCCLPNDGPWYLNVNPTKPPHYWGTYYECEFDKDIAGLLKKRSKPGKLIYTSYVNEGTSNRKVVQIVAGIDILLTKRGVFAFENERLIDFVKPFGTVFPAPYYNNFVLIRG